MWDEDVKKQSQLTVSDRVNWDKFVGSLHEFELQFRCWHDDQ